MKFHQLSSNKGRVFNLPILSLNLEYINENSLVIVEVNKTSADDEVEQNGDVGFEQKKRYVVMNVTGAQTSKVYDGDIIVKESDGDSELGFLCIADGKDITLSELTDFKAIAVHLDWLQSTSENEFHISPTSSFIIENSYLFVHADKYETYHSIYRDGAPIWGGFSHVEPSKKSTLSKPAQRIAISFVPPCARISSTSPDRSSFTNAQTTSLSCAIFAVVVVRRKS